MLTSGRDSEGKNSLLACRLAETPRSMLITFCAACMSLRSRWRPLMSYCDAAPRRSSKHQMKILQIIVVSVSTALLIGVGIYEYPYFMVQSYEKEWPEAWNSELYKLNYQQIVDKIGPPTEVAPAKQYQSWLKREPWGMFQLKIIFKNCCDDEVRPSEIYQIVRVIDRYEPARVSRLPSPFNVRQPHNK